MKKILLSLTILVGLSFAANAQSGNNQLQASAQASFPVGSMKDFSKTGFGFAGKGMFGFGGLNQQVTIEAGYVKFKLDQPGPFATDYSTIPVYAGYRYLTGSLFIEPQVGVAIDHFTAGYIGATSTEARLGWAFGFGYQLTNLEIGAKYQSSIVSGTSDLKFISIRLGYNFKL